LTGDPGAG